MNSAQSFGLNAGDKVHCPVKRHHKKGASQTGQTKTCMWINEQIISRSQPGSSVDELIFMISEHLHNMNLVNLTTAIHRLAKMVAHDAKAQARLRESSMLAKVLLTITNVLSSTQSKNIKSQSLCNLVWSLATIRIVDTCVISLVCGHTLPNICRFKPYELALLLWGLAKLSTVESASPFDSTHLKSVFDLASKYLEENARSMECRSLSMVVWAYATVSQFNAPLFALIATQIANGPTPSCQEMANIAWAFGTQNITHLELFTFLAHKGVENIADFKAQELSNMLWGFASSCYFHEQFYHCVATVALSMDLSTQHLVNIFWSFSRVRPNHPLTQRVILSFLPACLRQMRNFKIQEVSSVALSIAKTFVGSDAPSSLPAVVMDFFRSISNARYHLAEFSTRSLIDMSSAIAMLHLYDIELLGLLGREAVVRAPSMEASDLLQIFQIYLLAQAESPDCAHIAGLLLAPLSVRLRSLRPREVKSLSHSSSEFLREANRQDVIKHCAHIIDSICRDTCSKSLDGRYAYEMSSGAETDEPENSTSEFSDSAAGDADCNTCASNTRCNANQQVPDAYAPTCIPTMNGDYFCVAMPIQQHLGQSNFGWSQQQQPSWRNEQGFKHIPIGRNSNIENRGFIPAAFSDASRAPVAPPSSLLWDVGINTGLTSRTSVDSLQIPDRSDAVKAFNMCTDRVTKQHHGDIVDSSSSIVVKNTFIEYQSPNSKGISSVHFCSEQVSRQSAAKDRALKTNSRLAQLLVPADGYDTDDGF